MAPQIRSESMNGWAPKRSRTAIFERSKHANRPTSEIADEMARELIQEARR